MEDQILGNCDCPGGPRVTSKLHPDANYFHVQTPRGIRCCRRTPEGEIRYGTIIKPSPEEIASREAAKKRAKDAALKKAENRKLRSDFVEKRKTGETTSLEDLTKLVDTLLN